MKTFRNIKELIAALNKEEPLLSEMFKKRKSINFKYEYALDAVDNNNNRLQYLLSRSVLSQNGNYLELDDLFLQFFEQILGASEEINTSYINENLVNLTQNIQYYLNENDEQRKYKYLRLVKRILKNVGDVTLRNIVDLKRNVDNTFKNEPNYKNKKAKLIHLDQKRISIIKLIEQSQALISDAEVTFFQAATDEELNNILVQLKIQLAKSTHNLIEIERQIIDFLNQILHHSQVIEKLLKIKYFKDQYVLESATNIKMVLAENKALTFESRPQYPLKLSLDYLQISEVALLSIRGVAKRIKSGAKLKQAVADKISDEYLETQIQEEYQVNLEELKNGFMASGYGLFDFLMRYNFSVDLSFDDKITIYCQLISQYESNLTITDNFELINDFEIALVYPK